MACFQVEAFKVDVIDVVRLSSKGQCVLTLPGLPTEGASRSMDTTTGLLLVILLTLVDKADVCHDWRVK